MELRISTEKQWVTLNHICIAFLKQKYYRKVKDLWDEIGHDVSKPLFHHVLNYLQSSGILDVKQEGDIKHITLKDKKSLIELTRDFPIVKEVTSLQKAVGRYTWAYDI